MRKKKRRRKRKNSGEITICDKIIDYSCINGPHDRILQVDETI